MPPIPQAAERGELPALPEPDPAADEFAGNPSVWPVYTANQMWDYARAALEAAAQPVPSAPEPSERAVRIWWKTGPEGEFMMSPALKGDAERMLADGWRPTYDGPATSPTEVEIRAEYDGFIDPEMLRLARDVVASRSATPPVPAAAPSPNPAPPAAQPEADALDAKRLDRFQTGWELSQLWDDDGVYWAVQRRCGGVNDREWKLICRGDTIRAAIDAAIASQGTTGGQES